jgi:hypothetical protein
MRKLSSNRPIKRDSRDDIFGSPQLVQGSSGIRQGRSDILSRFGLQIKLGSSTNDRDAVGPHDNVKIYDGVDFPCFHEGDVMMMSTFFLNGIEDQQRRRQNDQHKLHDSESEEAVNIEAEPIYGEAYLDIGDLFLANGIPCAAVGAALFSVFARSYSNASIAQEQTTAATSVVTGNFSSIANLENDDGAVKPKPNKSTKESVQYNQYSLRKKSTAAGKYTPSSATGDDDDNGDSKYSTASACCRLTLEELLEAFYHILSLDASSLATFLFCLIDKVNYCRGYLTIAEFERLIELTQLGGESSGDGISVVDNSRIPIGAAPTSMATEDGGVVRDSQQETVRETVMRELNQLQTRTYTHTSTYTQTSHPYADVVTVAASTATSSNYKASATPNYGSSSSRPQQQQQFQLPLQVQKSTSFSSLVPNMLLSSRQTSDNLNNHHHSHHSNIKNHNSDISGDGLNHRDQSNNDGHSDHHSLTFNTNTEGHNSHISAENNLISQESFVELVLSTPLSSYFAPLFHMQVLLVSISISISISVSISILSISVSNKEYRHLSFAPQVTTVASSHVA